MKRNFYLQHPLMAMHDPRMQYLLKMEKLKGTGAYWFVIEKLAMLPGSCVDMEFLRPYCKMHKISFAYVKKIILGYELFDFEEDGSFAPAELNPLHKSVQKREETVADKTGKPEDSVRKTVPKTTGNVSESSVSWSKNDEKRQKTSREKAAKHTEKSDKTLNDSIISESVDTDNKENIKDILTTAAEEKERKFPKQHRKRADLWYNAKGHGAEESCLSQDETKESNTDEFCFAAGITRRRLNRERLPGFNDVCGGHRI